MHRRNFTYLILFLGLALGSGLRADPPALSPLATALKKALIDRLPGVMESDPTQWTPETFQKMGVTAEQFKYAMDELRTAYPTLAAKMEEGQSRRVKYRESLDRKADPILARQNIDTRSPYSVYQSYAEFVKNARDQNLAPLTPDRVRMESSEDTRRMYSGFRPKWQDEIPRFYQGREQKHSLEDEIYNEQAITEENFNYWRDKEIKRIENLIIQNSRALAISRAKKDTKKEELRSAGITLSEDKNGDLQASMVVGQKSTQFPVAKGLPPLGTFKGKEKESDLFENRVAQLNSSLAAMRKLLKAANWSRPPEVLDRNLRQQTTRYKEYYSTSENLISLAGSEFWGSDLDKLIWSKVKNSYGPWHNRQRVSKLFSLYRENLASTLGHQKVQKGFLKTFVPIAALTAAAWVGPQVGMWETDLNPAYEVMGTAWDATSAVLGSVADALDHSRALDYYQPPEKSDSPPVVNQGETKQKVFEIISGPGLAPSWLELASQEEMKDLKPFQMSTAHDEFGLRSVLRHYPVNGKVALPGGKDHLLSFVEIKADGKVLSANDFTVKQTETGIPVVVLADAYKNSEIFFETKYAKDPAHRIKYTIPVERVQAWADQLKRSGFLKASAGLQKEIDEAKAGDQDRILGERVTEIYKETSLYSYHAPHAELDLPDNDPLKSLTIFLSEDGTYCAQCTGSGEFEIRSDKFNLGDDPSLKIWKMRTIFRTNDGYETPFHIVGNIAPVDDLRSKEVHDATASNKDPRAPEPKSRTSAVGSWFSRHLWKVTPPFPKASKSAEPGKPPAKSDQETKTEEKPHEESVKASPKEKESEKVPDPKAAAKERAHSAPRPVSPSEAAEGPTISAAENKPFSGSGPLERPRHALVPPGTDDAWPGNVKNRLLPPLPKIPHSIIVPPPPAGIEELDTLLKQIEKSPSFNQLRRMTGERFYKLPPTLAYTLGRALVDYARGQKPFSELADAFRAIYPSDPELNITHDSQIPAALLHAEKRLNELMPLFAKSSGISPRRLQTSALAGRVSEVFQIAKANPWQLHPEGRVSFCKNAYAKLNTAK